MLPELPWFFYLSYSTTTNNDWLSYIPSYRIFLIHHTLVWLIDLKLQELQISFYSTIQLFGKVDWFFPWFDYITLLAVESPILLASDPNFFEPSPLKFVPEIKFLSLCLFIRSCDCSLPVSFPNLFGLSLLLNLFLSPKFWPPITVTCLCSWSNEFFKMFSHSSGVAGIISHCELFILQELLFILDYFTTINNNYRLYYHYKFKKKHNAVISILTLKLISNIFLLFLVTMTTYTANTKEIEGVTLDFCAYHEASIPVIHYTFNAVYGLDLYDADFHFIFEDVAKNGLT